MKKRLYVPHPGHFDGPKELVSEAGKDIYSIFMAGSPDYVGTGRSNLSSPQIEDIREQTLYAHKNGAKVEIMLNSSCMGGRQLTPAEKHAAQDEYSQITKRMRHCRQFRADAIQAAGRGCEGKYCQWYVETVGLGIIDGGKIEEISEGYANLSIRRRTICQIVRK